MSITDENLKDVCTHCLEVGKERPATSSDGKLCDKHAYHRAKSFADTVEDLKFIPPNIRK